MGGGFSFFPGLRGKASQGGQWPRPKEEELGVEKWIKLVWLEGESCGEAFGGQGKENRVGTKKQVALGCKNRQGERMSFLTQIGQARQEVPLHG